MKVEIRFIVRVVAQVGGIIHLILEPETPIDEHQHMSFMPISTNDDERVMMKVMQGVQKGLMSMEGRSQHQTCMPLKPKDYEILNKPTIGDIVVVALECVSVEKKENA